MQNEPYRVVGVGRIAGEDKTIALYLDRPITDEELRALHDHLIALREVRAWLVPGAATRQ